MSPGWIDHILESPIDLAIARVSEQPGMLMVSTRMTTALAVLASVFGLLSLGFIIHAWLHRATPLDIIWPHAVLIPAFGLIALVFGFGHHEKTFHLQARTLTSTARLGPLKSSHSYSLPNEPTVKITFRLVYPSTSKVSPRMPVRWYDVDIPDVPAAGFTIANNRNAAREFARKLATALNAKVIDQVEDDGVERH